MSFTISSNLSLRHWLLGRHHVVCITPFSLSAVLVVVQQQQQQYLYQSFEKTQAATLRRRPTSPRPIAHRSIYNPPSHTQSMSLSRRPSPLRATSSAAYNPHMAPSDSNVHPVIHEGRVAVVTGAGSGIGRAAAIELAK